MEWHRQNRIFPCSLHSRAAKTKELQKSCDNLTSKSKTGSENFLVGLTDRVCGIILFSGGAWAILCVPFTYDEKYTYIIISAVAFHLQLQSYFACYLMAHFAVLWKNLQKFLWENFFKNIKNLAHFAHNFF